MDVNKIISKIQNGDFEDVERLIKENPDKVKETTSNGLTLLMAACERGSISLITLLTESGADLNIGDKDKRTALHYAVDNRQTEAVAFLVSRRANVNEQNSQGDTPLHRAVWNKDEDVVKVLLNIKGNNNLQVNKKNKDSKTPLHLASQNGQTKIVKLLLEHNGTDICAVTNSGDTPLHLASFLGHIDIVKLLLQQKGTGICAVTQSGCTPLHHACRYGHTDTATLLLQQNGIDANKVDKAGDTPLHLAVQKQHHNVVAAMLAQDSVKLDTENNRKRTPLLEAVSAAHLGIIHDIITHGANMNAIDNDGNNCLHLSIIRKEIFHSEVEPIPILDECCKELPLDEDRRLSGIVVLSYLANQGASLYHRNNKNMTPLDYIKNQLLKENLQTFLRSLCRWCQEKKATVTLHPCQHTVICQNCCSQMTFKQCPICRQHIHSKSGFVCPKFEEKAVQAVVESVECPRCREKTVKTVAESFVFPKSEEKVVKTMVEYFDSIMVEEKHLHRVSQKLGGKWMVLGRELGIQQNDLETIKHDHTGNTMEQGFQMLLKWFRSNDPAKRRLQILKKALVRTECYEAHEYLSSEFN
ncbi:putative ankyrin repeat protein RF_0381 isoform X2 [Octopus sinensis]|uniref:Ankyrin repeat protein RF_0381 isoform X2 n=1 Tax=Octopus sinensis TaxID=2607531 RepID=A0A6P7U8L0_9MOLL|nr:putative ankyrin repeat protein RF_0381 isoform X2 [Octopus sinensis]